MFVSSRTNIKFLPVKLILFSSVSLSNLAVITNTLPLYHPLTFSCLYNHLNFAQIHLLPVCKNAYPLAFSCVKIVYIANFTRTPICPLWRAYKSGWVKLKFHTTTLLKPISYILKVSLHDYLDVSSIDKVMYQ